MKLQEVTKFNKNRMFEGVITKYIPTAESRWVQLTEYSIPRFMRRFYCELSDGSTGKMWLEVRDSNTFAPLESELIGWKL
jgi:hypothetical protein